MNGHSSGLHPRTQQEESPYTVKLTVQQECATQWISRTDYKFIIRLHKTWLDCENERLRSLKYTSYLQNNARFMSRNLFFLNLNFQTLMNAQVLRLTSVPLTPCVPTLTVLTSVAALGALQEMGKTVPVNITFAVVCSCRYVYLGKVHLLLDSSIEIFPERLLPDCSL